MRFCRGALHTTETDTTERLQGKSCFMHGDADG